MVGADDAARISAAMATLQPLAGYSLPGGDRGPFAAATELPLDYCPGRDGLGPSRSPSAEVPLPNWSPAIEGPPRRQGPVWWSDSQNPATELSVPTAFEAVLS